MAVDKFVKEVISEEEVNWNKYLEWWDRATGEASGLAREVIEEVNNDLIDKRIVTAVKGYMIEHYGAPFDVIEAYNGAGLRTRLRSEEDAEQLAEVLGEHYSVVHIGMPNFLRG